MNYNLNSALSKVSNVSRNLHLLISQPSQPSKPSQTSKLSQPNSQSSTNKGVIMLQQFARVKGSGPFLLDDFCAVTGMQPSQALKCLLNAEKQDALLRLGDLFLLYPTPTDNRRIWYDWKFDLNKQRRIFDACYVNDQSNGSQIYGVSFAELREKLPYSKTLLRRYLAAMTHAGILITHRNSYLKFYRQGIWRSLTTYRQELAKYNNSSLITHNS